VEVEEEEEDNELFPPPPPPLYMKFLHMTSVTLWMCLLLLLLYFHCI